MDYFEMTVMLSQANCKPPADRFPVSWQCNRKPGHLEMRGWPIGDPELALVQPLDKTERTAMPVEAATSRERENGYKNAFSGAQESGAGSAHHGETPEKQHKGGKSASPWEAQSSTANF